MERKRHEHGESTQRELLKRARLPPRWRRLAAPPASAEYGGRLEDMFTAKKGRSRVVDQRSRSGTDRTDPVGGR